MNEYALEEYLQHKLANAVEEEYVIELNDVRVRDGRHQALVFLQKMARGKSRPTHLGAGVLSSPLSYR